MFAGKLNVLSSMFVACGVLWFSLGFAYMPLPSSQPTESMIWLWEYLDLHLTSLTKSLMLVLSALWLTYPRATLVSVLLSPCISCLLLYLWLRASRTSKKGSQGSVT